MLKFAIFCTIHLTNRLLKPVLPPAFVSNFQLKCTVHYTPPLAQTLKKGFTIGFFDTMMFVFFKVLRAFKGVWGPTKLSKTTFIKFFLLLPESSLKI